jgi:copper homeostasis protein
MELEIVCTSIESVEIATDNGATRIELCMNLSSGGLTPTAGFFALAKKATSLPIFPLIRAREGSFAYSEMEKQVMFDDMKRLLDMGADGLVIGALEPSGGVDFDFAERAMDQCAGVPMTFHRAFDECLYPDETLKTLKKMGFDRVLTAGCAPTAQDGLENLQRFLSLDGVPTILPGGGIRFKTAEALLEMGFRELHAAPQVTISQHPQQQLFASDYQRVDGDEVLRISTLMLAMER